MCFLISSSLLLPITLRSPVSYCRSNCITVLTEYARGARPLNKLTTRLLDEDGANALTGAYWLLQNSPDIRVNYLYTKEFPSNLIFKMFSLFASDFVIGPSNWESRFYKKH